MSIVKAIYPTRIPDFPTHQDIIEQVQAIHVNALQRELTSVIITLGTNPHVYNDINIPEVFTQAYPNDTGSVIDDDTMYQGQYRFYDPTVTPVNHGTVGQRLDDIERGKTRQVFTMTATNLDIASKNTDLSTRPKAIKFPKPSAKEDPASMYNGTGVTLRKSGHWDFTATVIYNLQGNTAHSNDGRYQASIDHDNNWIEGMERSRESGNNDHPVLNPRLKGYFAAGTIITLRSSQDSGRNQKIRKAMLAGHLVREDDPSGG